MRKLATVRVIDQVKAIEGADRIQAYRLGGWWVVDKINAHNVGDLVVYLEVDSWVPHELAPFLSKGKEPREYNGVKGERLKTAKLRGQISQGIILPVSVVPDDFVIEGTDCTEVLGIQKYEKPTDRSLSGDAKGTFPSFISKTDQERAQNLTHDIRGWYHDRMDFEITEKLDGSSCTIYYRDGEIGVCSRNLELKETEGNVYWYVARKQGLIDLLQELGQNIALQGEVIGPKIQKNQYALDGIRFHLFDVFDIDTYSFWNPVKRHSFFFEAKEKCNIFHVPILAVSEMLPSENVSDLLVLAEGKSVLNPKVHREGIVMKSNVDAGIYFKAISNKWLMKNE